MTEANMHRHLRVRKDPIRSHRVLINNEKQRAPRRYIAIATLQRGKRNSCSAFEIRPASGRFHQTSDTAAYVL
jgi:hypothetical protein